MSLSKLCWGPTLMKLLKPRRMDFSRACRKLLTRNPRKEIREACFVEAELAGLPEELG